MRCSLRLAAIAVIPCLVAGCNGFEVASPARPTLLADMAGEPAGPHAPGRQYPGTGQELVDFVSQQHPDRLAAGVSHGERVRNMEFLRDEIIRAGMCGGLDLARNLKRGVGPHSTDAIAWRHADGHVDVVDVAAAYDDTGFALRLHWLVVEGPPGYDPIPRSDCR